jgi:hypothetical protein
MTTNQHRLISKIRTKGWNQQERQYLFPSLYGQKAVTRNTRGQFATFERQLRRGKYAPMF